jgi:hypothetical protein
MSNEGLRVIIGMIIAVFISYVTNINVILCLAVGIWFGMKIGN